MSWYRTYRPQAIKELDLKQVREQLLSLLKSGNIPHALLFSGPKGTGKTSSARILAKVVNCDANADVRPGKPLSEPCGKCDMCKEITNGRSLNVVEMDAASNRRIDDIRELRERIYVPPALGKKLVYIIDEVHMLTNEAFNALLKILEEPPEHVLFILATTEHHKIPETIQSRCTLIQFRKANENELSEALSKISLKEKISVEDEVFASIMQSADGSFRDAVKILEQLVEQSGKKTLTLEFTQKHLSTVGSKSIEQLVKNILSKDEKAVVMQFVTWQEQSSSPLVIHELFLGYLHLELQKSLGIKKGEAVASTKVLQFLLKHFGSIVCDMRLPFPLLPLEMEIVEIILKSKEQKKNSSSSSSTNSSSTRTLPKSAPEPKNASPSVAVSERLIESKEGNLAEALESPFQSDTVIEKENAEVDLVVAFANGSSLSERWNDLLSLVGRQNLSVEALLRSSQFLSGEDGVARIQVFYQFHKEQLELDRYRSIIEASIEELLGGRVKVEFELTRSAIQKGASQESNISGKVEDELVNLAEELVVSA